MTDDTNDTPFMPTFMAAPSFTSGGALIDEVVMKLRKRIEKKRPPLLLTERVDEPESVE